MLNKTFRRAYRISGLPYRWSHTAEDFYPVTPTPRWEPGRMPYTKLYSILNEQRRVYEKSLDAMASHAHLLHSVHAQPQKQAPNAPYWNNTWFSRLDAGALINFIAWKQPRRYIEIGSGHSTRFVRHTIDAQRLTLHVTSVDPQPRQEINQLCDRIIRSPLETCDLSLFDELAAGDILFFDGSHRVFTNSDVTVFFFEVLPRLKPGVIVHIHDIFIPHDYPPDWNRRFYSEQYLLASILMCRPPFRILLANAFITEDPALQKRVIDVYDHKNGANVITIQDYSRVARSTSFWVEMTGAT